MQVDGVRAGKQKRCPGKSRWWHGSSIALVPRGAMAAPMQIVAR